MSTLLAVPNYFTVTVYVDETIMDRLLKDLRVTIVASDQNVPIRHNTFVHVHDHSNRHVKAYLDTILDKEEGNIEVILDFVMNLTVG